MSAPTCGISEVKYCLNDEMVGRFHRGEPCTGHLVKLCDEPATDVYDEVAGPGKYYSCAGHNVEAVVMHPFPEWVRSEYR